MLILFLLASLAIFVAVGPGLKNLARNRKYKSGTGWCAWRWTDVDSEYILRLHVVKTPWFAICLHWIQKPDLEPWLHDHPVSFLSIILRGKYAEMRRRGDGPTHIQVNRWFNFIRASLQDKHRIIFCRNNTLTLCFMGPKTQEWGFTVNGTWTYWKTYYEMLKNGVDLRRENIPYGANADGTHNTSVYRVDDYSDHAIPGWYWSDETGAPSGPYKTRAEADNAQNAYIIEGLGV